MITAIFDLDGTLADTLQDLADAVNFGLRELGLPEHPVDDYRKMVGNGAPVLCCRALPEEHKDMAEQLHEIFRSYYGVHYLDHTRLYEGLSETLERLQNAGVCMAVATNKPQDVARRVVAKLMPEVDFALVLGGCSERPKKPDPAIIREILSNFPDHDNKVYMIGDSNVDIRTARNAGITSIGCTWGFRKRQELVAEGAAYIAEKPRDIADIILEQEG